MYWWLCGHMQWYVYAMVIGGSTYWQGDLMHNATHYNVCHNRRVNELLGWWLCLGCFSNPTAWFRQHVVMHHAYTNEPARDPDLDHFNHFFRISKQHKMMAHFPWYKRYCWLVLPLLLKLYINVLASGHCVVQGIYPGCSENKKIAS